MSHQSGIYLAEYYERFGRLSDLNYDGAILNSFSGVSTFSKIRHKRNLFSKYISGKPDDLLLIIFALSAILNLGTIFDFSTFL